MFKALKLNDSAAKKMSGATWDKDTKLEIDTSSRAASREMLKLTAKQFNREYEECREERSWNQFTAGRVKSALGAWDNDADLMDVLAAVGGAEATVDVKAKEDGETKSLTLAVRYWFWCDANCVVAIAFD